MCIHLLLEMDVLERICSAAIKICGGVEVAGFAREVASCDPGQSKVARRADRVEGVLRRVDPLDCDRMVALGRECACDDELRVSQLVAKVDPAREQLHCALSTYSGFDRAPRLQEDVRQRVDSLREIRVAAGFCCQLG